MKIQYIFVHHTASSRVTNPDQWEATNRDHQKKWNFKGSLGFYVGYNYEISATGVVRQSRKDGEVTAAQYQQNMNNGQAIAICLDGNFEIEQPTFAQLNALKKLVEEKVKAYGIPVENVRPHRSISATACPGKFFPSTGLYDFLMKQPAGEAPNPADQIPDWPDAKPAVDAAIKAGIIANTSGLMNPLSISGLETILSKAKVLEKKEGSITLIRLLIALYRGGLIK